jgi:hypothetical protein
LKQNSPKKAQNSFDKQALELNFATVKRRRYQVGKIIYLTEH